MSGCGTPDVLTVDGSHGEGGGQILRTSVTLAAITQTPVRMVNIRVRRRRPGLAAQHLTAVRAAASLCRAHLEGDQEGSLTLDFSPQCPVRAGEYEFDVAAARKGGSAGSTTLVLQCVLPALALAAGTSTIALRGGTHVPGSPPADWLRDVWLPALASCGLQASLEIVRTGWYPVGKGELRVQVRGRERGRGRMYGEAPWAPLVRRDPGPLRQVSGRAIAASLPAHICQRMADRAAARLHKEGVATRIEPVRLDAACPGAGIFLTAEYEHARAGFNALGAPGRPAENVADAAVEALLDHRATGAAVDLHLADQLVVPLSLAQGTSEYTVERVTRHLLTNAHVVANCFGVAQVQVLGKEGEPGEVVITAHGRLDKQSR